MTRAVNLASAGSIVSESVGTAPGYMARAWVNFNGTGTVAIRASGNVTSITDNGTGDYTVNFTTAMPDANYAGNVTAGANAVKLTIGAYQGTQTTSTFRVGVTNFAGSNEDQSSMFVSIFR